MSFGAVFLETRGVALAIPPRRSRTTNANNSLEIEYREYNITRGYGAFGGSAKDGICGAPIVEEDSGGVIGFFQFSSPDWVFSPVLDDIIDAGWDVV